MNRDDLIPWVAEHVPALLQREFERKDLCVLATRLGCDVFDYFGVSAKPVVVRVIAYNAAWHDFQREHPDLGDPAWAEAKTAGHEWWSVGIDEEDHGRPGRFPGHLVLYTPGDENFLLDLSFTQFARPERGMDFPDALVMPVPDDFPKGEPIVFSTPSGAGVAYRARPGVSSFRRGADWKMRSELSGELIRAARAEALSCR